MSGIAFVNIGMHGHVNPTLPLVAELVRRGHLVTYHADPAFCGAVEAEGARARPYPPDEVGHPDPPEPITLMAGIAARALAVLPGVLDHLGRDAPDLVIHDAACLWAPVAARCLGIPTIAMFTTFAYNRRVASPAASSPALWAAAVRDPASVGRYVGARWALRRRYGARGLPLFDVLNARAPTNLVFTSREVHPAADSFDDSYRFVGPSIGTRPATGAPPGELREPVVLASLGTLYTTDRDLFRRLVTALAPLAGTLVVATGRTDPADLGPLPHDVVAERFVPQLDVLARAALFVTHGGVNSVNEALSFGVPMVLVPQGADQPLVARRIAELGAGLAVSERPARIASIRAAARRVLTDERFATTAARLQRAQHDAGGAARAVQEIEARLARSAAR